MTPILRTERLLLEPYVPEDEESFVALFMDTRVSQWMGDGPSPEAEVRSLFWRVFSVYDEERFDVWAVHRDGRYVGHAELKPTDVTGGHEVIYALTPATWGSGLGTELAAALVDYGFASLELDEIHATVAAPNHASRTVLQKLGFAHVRDIPNDAGTNTHWFTRPRCTTTGGDHEGHNRL